MSRSFFLLASFGPEPATLAMALCGLIFTAATRGQPRLRSQA